MAIYIEQVIIDNMVVNYFLLWFCSLVLKLEKCKTRFFVASLVGTCFALVMPLFTLPSVVAIVAKLMLGSVIILLAFKFKTPKQFLGSFFAFVCFTFLLGGAVFGFMLSFLSGEKLVLQGNFSYSSSVPVGVFLLLGFMVFKVFYDIIFFSVNKQKLSQLKFELCVYNQNKAFNINAFLDTGNLLVDSKSNQPIVVINFNAFKQITGTQTEDFLLGNYTLKNSRYENISTANKSSKMLVFEVDKIALNHKNGAKTLKNAVLGLSLSNFSKNLDCDALIGLNLVNVEGV